MVGCEHHYSAYRKSWGCGLSQFTHSYFLVSAVASLNKESLANHESPELVSSTVVHD